MKESTMCDHDRIWSRLVERVVQLLKIRRDQVESVSDSFDPELSEMLAYYTRMARKRQARRRKTLH